MNRMLINATHKDEELRIALATGQYLYDLIIESTSREQKQSNIYKGTVTRIEPSLEAAFVDYGEGRHGFLPLKEVARPCFKKSYHDNGRRPSITEVLAEGQELIVQVEKEERGNKGAALTTFITLPGCYLVLMPNNPRAGGVSRRIEGDERDELHSVLNTLQVPEGMGLIIRTAGGGRSQEELQWDLEILLRLWNVIKETASEDGEGEGSSNYRPAPFLIYQEGNAVIRALRDYLRKDIDEILVDHPDVYDDVVNHLKLIRPDFIHRVKLYKDATPLFTRFQIESQIESAFQRDVRLPSGGSIIIDHTEALVSIDINSAKSTKGGDIEETALMTNLEAANEIARQLRLRDIGGLIVIDFIDMTPIRNQREVEDRLKKALAMDRARVQIGRISRFGLLEMSRQRLRPSLGESSRITCPRCLGQGTIRGVESLGLSVIRIIEEEALKENTAQVRAILPTEIAAYLLNEKRQSIIDIEKRQGVSIIVVPSNYLLTPQYEVERIRLSDITEKDEKTASYKLAIKPEVTSSAGTQSGLKSHQEPAIKHAPTTEVPTPPVTSTQLQPPLPTPKGQPGLLKRVFTFLFEKKEQQQVSTDESRNRMKRPPHARMRPPRRKGSGTHQHHRGGRRDRNRSGGTGYRSFDNRDNRDNRDNKPRENVSSEHQTKDTQSHSRPDQSTEHRGNRDNHSPRDHHEQHSHQQHSTRPAHQQHSHTAHPQPAPQHEQAQPIAPKPVPEKQPVNDSMQAESNVKSIRPTSDSGTRDSGTRDSGTRDTGTSSANENVQPQANTTSSQGEQAKGEHSNNPNRERKRPHYNARRRKHRHPSARHDANEHGRHSLEGEDIYNTKKNKDEE